MGQVSTVLVNKIPKTQLGDATGVPPVQHRVDRGDASSIDRTDGTSLLPEKGESGAKNSHQALCSDSNGALLLGKGDTKFILALGAIKNPDVVYTIEKEILLYTVVLIW